MAFRSGHGKGKGTPRIEVTPADELPLGVPSNAEPPLPSDFDKRGKFAPGNSVARLGGVASAGKARLACRVSMRGVPQTAAFNAYKRSASAFRKAQCSELAKSVGGGYCGPGPSSFVASAAIQLAWSRYFSDLAAESGDPQHVLTASRLADASRQNLLAAHELCAREAKCRAEDADADVRRQQLDFQAKLLEGGK